MYFLPTGIVYRRYCPSTYLLKQRDVQIQPNHGTAAANFLRLGFRFCLISRRNGAVNVLHIQGNGKCLPTLNTVFFCICQERFRQICRQSCHRTLWNILFKNCLHINLTRAAANRADNLCCLPSLLICFYSQRIRFISRLNVFGLLLSGNNAVILICSQSRKFSGSLPIRSIIYAVLTAAHGLNRYCGIRFLHKHRLICTAAVRLRNGELRPGKADGVIAAKGERACLDVIFSRILSGIPRQTSCF